MVTERHNLTRRAVLGAGVAAPAAILIGTVAATDETPVIPGLNATPSSETEREAPSTQLEFVCSNCGGTAVTRDAWAEWDVHAQEWVLGAAFDQAYCHDCDEETHIDEIELSSEASD